MNGKSPILLLGILSGVLSIGVSLADDSNSPYIDSLRKSMPQEKDSNGYSESIQKKLPADDSTDYTDRLRHSDALKLQGTPSENYSEKEQKKLGPEDKTSAIEAVREGHSELHLKKPGDIHTAFGFRVGLGLSRNVTAEPGIGTGRNFNDVYGSNYAPDLSLFYEYQFFHSEIYGSLGAFGMGTVAFYNGAGQFALNPIISASDESTFGANSTGVNFRFFEMPVVGGLSYRLNLAKYLRPYIMGGPAGVPYYESRSDGHSGFHGLSHGLWGAAGVEILMDWVSKASDWERYDSYSIKHTYLTIEYSKLSTFSSPVDFSVAGPYAGFTFEM